MTPEQYAKASEGLGRELKRISDLLQGFAEHAANGISPNSKAIDKLQRDQENVLGRFKKLDDEFWKQIKRLNVPQKKSKAQTKKK
jgi:hypothetical protein